MKASAMATPPAVRTANAMPRGVLMAIGLAVLLTIVSVAAVRLSGTDIC